MKWISASNELPGHLVDVLMWSTLHNICTVGYYNHRSKTWTYPVLQSPECSVVEDSYSVSHWQLLPESPEKGQE